ncbi:glycoside hydrolase family 3 N-terminal domain-containing protein [Konateibacter massiliensis]|uniref:glycoside hydrolase family 3 N-terminal domain-containing protein n=1 Tax=Konateibacter massiliensis TaxID=2002841 RepID=UPI000C148978|nr:glycoside hydrolase family 3 N-terminal domain-containing protein [Konateibacter massiliensis]
MKKEKKVKKKGMVGKIIRTTGSGILCLVLVVIMIAANTILASNNRMVDMIAGGMVGASFKHIDNSGAKTDGFDLEYNKSDYTKDSIAKAEDALKNQISEEGLVLLKNDNNALPISKDETLSFFSVNSNTLSVGGGLLGGGSNLKDTVEADGMKVNDKLWDFYSKQAKSGYGLASGSISFGDAEDFSINEVPLSALEEDASVLDSVKGTIPVYVLKRVAGEGRDMPRSMYNHADNTEDKAKSYLEPDSTELEVLQYLNNNFENVILVVNSNAALELDWLADYPNITSVIYAPDGMLALADVITGTVNPSGRTVDTFAADALASPAAQNFGDYAYYKEDGSATKYNYVSYAEGIYVGYKYYETRYEDVVLGQGNAGEYDYASEVTYPFGYGLSYTSFDWSNQTTSWDGTVCTVTVDVTNTGDVAGKDVVEIYAQSPYTDYDKANGVEKASVELVGYTKTSELEPGSTETVTVTFDQEQLKAYDANNAKTYILDAGTYYITAAANAHDAVNNILTAKSANTGAMTATGNTDMVSTYEPSNTDVDTATYATDSYSGNEITNLFDDAAGDVTYMTRNDWTGTFPAHDGEPMGDISTWGNEINGEDGVSYTYGKLASEELIAQLDSFDSGTDIDPNSFSDEIVYGADNGLSLIDMRGLNYDDPKWDDLLDQLTAEEYYEAIAQSGYGIDFIESVNMPFCVDADTASGLIYGGTGAMFPNMMTLAQTWNQELASAYGEMIGNEAILGGADGWYAPSMNIHRTPFSGRNGEYYSEDGFLSGTVASNEVKGAASKGMYTYIKHFAFNDQEDHRGDRMGQYGAATWLNEQSARELYLMPFEMCMKNGNVDLNYIQTNEDGTYENATTTIRATQAVMTAFNRVGATWTGGSYALITGVLRNEWAFNGLVLTDNANTGVFMDGYQMIEAGADAKLTYAKESARFDFDKDSSATYHYGRESMHRLLYTVVNSKAMNGAMPGCVFEDKATFVDKLIVGINIICPLLILLMGVLTIKRFRKKKTVLIVEE